MPMRASEPKALGDLIRRHRLASGLSQESLAAASGVSVRTISDLERGQRPSAQMETLRLLADAMRLEDDVLRALLEASHPELRKLDAPSSPEGSPRLETPWEQSLPIPSTPLVGREQDVAAVLTLLETGPRNVVTLTGPGGVGKTRLAIEVAGVMAPSLTDGVAFVDLADLSHSALVAGAIARELGISIGSVLLPERLTAFLQHRELLLVLDNFEHVVDAAPLVARLNERADGSRILITSRMRLRISPEREYPVVPLDLPATGGSLPHVQSSGAVQLFSARARAANPDFSLTAANAAAVSLICRRIDGLPLAIELVASRLKVLPVATLLARLDPALPLLTGGERDKPSRQQSMRETIAWSYGLLSPGEQQVFRWLSVFIGGFSLEAAEAAGAAVGIDAMTTLEIVSALVESGLLQRLTESDAGPRFRMLETVREFGFEQLGEIGEIAKARMAHALHILAVCAEGAPRPGEPVKDAWVGRLHREHANLVAAFDYVCRPETSALCIEYAVAFGPYSAFGLPGEEGWSRLSLALDLAGPTPSRLRAETLFWTALLLHESNEPALSSDLGREGLAIARALGDQTMEAAAVFVLAMNEELQEHWDAATSMYQQALGMWKALENGYMQAWTLMYLGGISFARGDLSRARAQEEEAARLFEMTAGTLSQAATQWYLGIIALADGRPVEAAGHYERSLGLWLATEHRSHWFKPLVHLADVAAQYGCHEHAARLLGAADRMLRETGASLFPFDVPASERAQRASRAAMSDAVYAAAYTAGQRSSPASWLADARTVVDVVTLS